MLKCYQQTLLKAKVKVLLCRMAPFIVKLCFKHKQVPHPKPLAAKLVPLSVFRGYSGKGSDSGKT